MFVACLLDTAKARGFAAETCALDMGDDNNRVYGECSERGCAPIIPLRQTPDVAARRAQAAYVRARRMAVRRV